MKKFMLFIIVFSLSVGGRSFAQIDLKKIDLKNLDLKDIIGKVMRVKKGFAPKFILGNMPIPKIINVGEILGLKRNIQINKLFNTFKTGRTVYKIASYAGGAASLYGIIKEAADSSNVHGGKGVLISGLVTIGSGLIVKFLTKAASYKAVDIFNGIAVKKIKDIFSIKPATNTMGIGLFVKLN